MVCRKASFAAHPDMRSHTGIILSMGNRASTSISRNQGMRKRSSTEAEVVALEEAAGPMLWAARFLKHNGYKVTKCILFQDNRRTMLQESNGSANGGKSSRYLNIRCVCIKDLKDKKLVSIQHCATEEMVADYMTEPLHEATFRSTSIRF